MQREPLAVADLPDSLLQEFSGFVAAQIGLSFPRDRWPDLLRGMAVVARECSFQNVAPCMHSLMQKPLVRAQAEMLAAHLAVGETYFFREPVVFRVLEQELLPRLIEARRAAGKHLRIWSAGCCTGEEIYSVAILLNRLLPDPADWRITLLGTDINPRFLNKARKGAYRDWSFRDVPAWIGKSYFDRSAQGSYTILPHIRQQVRFDYLNLAEDDYPSVQNNTYAMDIVLCRNVLMYFDLATMKRVISKLHGALADGGYLIVSAAETAHDLFTQFAKTASSDAIFYRKEGTGYTVTSAAPARPPAPTKQRGIDLRHGAQAPEVSKPLQPEVSADPHALALLARSHANQGRLHEAVRYCDAAIAADKCDPALRYLQAVILEEMGLLDDAMAAHQRVLYLDQNFVLAHFALGNLCRRLGRKTAAVRHFVNAADLLDGYPPGEILPASEGLTAGHLVSIVRVCGGVA